MTKETWEEDKKFFNQLADKLEELFPKGECKERSQALVLNAFANIFHSQLLAAQKDKFFGDAGMNDACEYWYQKGREEKAPMGVSQWRNHGQKYGYWDFFAKEIKKEIIEECLEILNHSIGKDDAYKEILEKLKN